MLNRWSRTRGALGEELWSRVRQSKIVLFGAGRNGSTMAWELAALGVKSISVVDPDRFANENLDAACMLTESDVEQPKASALVSRLKEFRSDCAFTAYNESVTRSEVLRLVRKSDLIVSCVDNDAARLAGSILSRRLLRPHLDVGTLVTRDQRSMELNGDVRLLLPRDGCVSCVGGLVDPEAAWYDLRAPKGALPFRQSRQWFEERTGSLITINAISVSVGVQVWLEFLNGSISRSHWCRLRWTAADGLLCTQGSVTADESCTICQWVPGRQMQPQAQR